MLKKLALHGALATFIIVSYPIQSNAAAPGIAGAVATLTVIEKIRSELAGVINHAVDRGNYLVARSAMEMLSAIDSWKAANEKILNKAFHELDDKSKNLFADANQIISKTNSYAEYNIETARQITENVNQIAETTIFSDKRSYVLRQLPRIIPPTATDYINLRLRGVNLDKADPVVTLNEATAQRSQLGPQEVNFKIPLAALPIDSSKIQIHTVNLEHKSRSGSFLFIFPKYEKLKRQITLVSLPSEIASYKFIATTRLNKKEISTHQTDVGRMSGRNTNIERIANPPPGWLWDLSSGEAAFSVFTTGRGEAGRCENIVWNGSREHGVIVKARVDAINEGPSWRYPSGRRADGYISCGVSGPAYKITETTENSDPITGIINWKHDITVPLPPNLESFELKIKIFDGRERTIINSDRDQFFEVIKGPNELVVKPLIPSEI